MTLPSQGAELRDLVAYFLWLGTTGFGGPIALVGFMQRDLVEKRRWFSEEEYREGLALAQLAPGPLAAQPQAGPPFLVVSDRHPRQRGRKGRFL